MRSAEEMDQADIELRETILKVWPFTAREKINLLVPATQGMIIFIHHGNKTECWVDVYERGKATRTPVLPLTRRWRHKMGFAGCAYSYADLLDKEYKNTHFLLSVFTTIASFSQELSQKESMMNKFIEW